MQKMKEIREERRTNHSSMQFLLLLCPYRANTLLHHHSPFTPLLLHFLSLRPFPSLSLLDPCTLSLRLLEGYLSSPEQKTRASSSSPSSFSSPFFAVGRRQTMISLFCRRNHGQRLAQERLHHGIDTRNISHGREEA